MSKIKFLLRDSYLAMVENSIGSSAFKEMFALVDGKRQNIVEGGKASCAFFAASILANFGLSKTGHGTVSSTIKDMLENGWYEIDELKNGAVVLWEKRARDGREPHEHLGFYVGNDEAVSNDWRTRSPQKHHYEFGQLKRKIEKIFWHPKLDS